MATCGCHLSKGLPWCRLVDIIMSLLQALLVVQLLGQELLRGGGPGPGVTPVCVCVWGGSTRGEGVNALRETSNRARRIRGWIAPCMMCASKQSDMSGLAVAYW
jgi:hypothetical protein